MSKLQRGDSHASDDKRVLNYEFSKEFIQRFLEKLKPDAESECILWQGSKTPDGYGVVRVPEDFLPGGRAYVHRVAFLLFRVGGIGPDEDVNHLCKTRACVNPYHLEPRNYREHRAETLKEFSDEALRDLFD